jgi:hypothetical protein
MPKTQTVRYRKVTPAHYNGPAWEVHLEIDGVLSAGTAGTVEKSDAGVWWGFYSDGGRAYPSWKRLDAAWALINS